MNKDSRAFIADFKDLLRENEYLPDKLRIGEWVNIDSMSNHFFNFWSNRLDFVSLDASKSFSYDESGLKRLKDLLKNVKNSS